MAYHRSQKHFRPTNDLKRCRPVNIRDVGRLDTDVDVLPVTERRGREPVAAWSATVLRGPTLVQVGKKRRGKTVFIVKQKD